MGRGEAIDGIESSALCGAGRIAAFDCFQCGGRAAIPVFGRLDFTIFDWPESRRIDSLRGLRKKADGATSVRSWNASSDRSKGRHGDDVSS